MGKALHLHGPASVTGGPQHGQLLSNTQATGDVLGKYPTDPSNGHLAPWLQPIFPILSPPAPQQTSSTPVKLIPHYLLHPT